MHPLLLDIPDTMETPRLTLRAYGPGDGAEYFSVIKRNREHLAGVMPNYILAIATAEESETFIRQLCADWAARNRFCFAIRDKQSNEFIGEIYIQGMDWDVPTIELGFYADVNHQGKGFITESVTAAVEFIFDHMQAHKICVVCDDVNLKSHAVAERCGFIQEGVLREQKRRPGGGYISSRFYGLLRSEYEKQRAKKMKP
ncbi:MAG: GNAT family protein [Rhodospirillaceae bacterium]|jgi:RimJ/RimL family protein N-acetyltransferase